MFTTLMCNPQLHTQSFLFPISRYCGVSVVHVVIGSSLVGDNTDWLGIYRPLFYLLSPSPSSLAIIIGAGGTARAAIYACFQLGFAPANIIISNRSHPRAVELATEFGVSAIDKSLTRRHLPQGKVTTNTREKDIKR